MPEPLMPKTGLGMNEAVSPCCAAMAFTVYFNVSTLSAERSAFAKRKSISCWPSATSWCPTSTSMPMLIKASINSVRTRTASSSDEKSK